MKMHKIKNIKEPLLNADGSWNIVCGLKSAHVQGVEIWEVTNCRMCLKKRPKPIKIIKHKGFTDFG